MPAPKSEAPAPALRTVALTAPPPLIPSQEPLGLQVMLPTWSGQKTCFSLLPAELIAELIGNVLLGKKEQVMKLYL